MTNFHISKYHLSLYPAPDANCRAVVTGVDTVRGSMVVAYFMAEGEELPTPKWHRDNIAYVYFHDWEYERVVDLLRHEEPVIFFAHGGTEEWRFGSGAEDVGDGFH